MSDRLDGRWGALRATAALLVAGAVAGCGPMRSLDPPVPPEPTPCTRATAVGADTVVITAGVCNPWCIHVAAGASVTFLNGDPALYYLTAEPVFPYDLQVPGYAGAVTLPLPVGAVTWTAVQAPSATVTVFVE